MTVAGLADRWLASNPLMRDSSRSRDASTVKQYIKPVIGLLKVAGPTKVTLQGLVDNWTAVDHLAPSTVHRMASTLHALFQYAVDDKKRLDNPPDDLKLPEVAQALGPGHSTFMCPGAETGLRWGEGAGITLGDLDLGAATLRVSLRLDRRPTALPHQEQDLRGHRPQPAMVAELPEHLERNGLVGAGPSTLIFSTSKRHRPLHYSNWRARVWVPACEQAGLAGFGFDDLGRSNATILHDEGTVVKAAQERLRHKQSSTTHGTTPGINTASLRSTRYFKTGPPRHAKKGPRACPGCASSLACVSPSPAWPGARRSTLDRKHPSVPRAGGHIWASRLSHHSWRVHSVGPRGE